MVSVTNLIAEVKKRLNDDEPKSIAACLIADGRDLAKMIAIVQVLSELAEFSEDEFKRQWGIRGVGMGLPKDAMHGARCFHLWFVKEVIVKADKIAGEP